MNFLKRVVGLGGSAESEEQPSPAMKPSPSLQDLNAAAKSDPKNPRLLYERGQKLLAHGDATGAIKDFTLAMDLSSPPPLSLLLARANAFAKRGEFYKARNELYNFFFFPSNLKKYINILSRPSRIATLLFLTLGTRPLLGRYITLAGIAILRPKGTSRRFRTMRGRSSTTTRPRTRTWRPCTTTRGSTTWPSTPPPRPSRPSRRGSTGTGRGPRRASRGGWPTPSRSGPTTPTSLPRPSRTPPRPSLSRPARITRPLPSEARQS
jgi:hypothetical protein